MFGVPADGEGLLLLPGPTGSPSFLFLLKLVKLLFALSIMTGMPSIADVGKREQIGIADAVFLLFWIPVCIRVSDTLVNEEVGGEVLIVEVQMKCSFFD